MGKVSWNAWIWASQVPRKGNNEVTVHDAADKYLEQDRCYHIAFAPGATSDIYNGVHTTGHSWTGSFESQWAGSQAAAYHRSLDCWMEIAARRQPTATPSLRVTSKWNWMGRSMMVDCHHWFLPHGEGLHHGIIGHANDYDYDYDDDYTNHDYL